MSTEPGAPQGGQSLPLVVANLQPDLTQEELDRLVAKFTD